MSGLGTLRTGDTEKSPGERFGTADTERPAGTGRASGLGSALGGRRRNNSQPDGTDQTQESAPQPGAVAVWTGNETSSFAGGRLLSAADIVGTRQEQLAFVTAHLREISRLGTAAEDYVVLTKSVLLEVAKERELHKEAGVSKFARWAADVLDVAEQYIFELLKDAQRIRTLALLKPELRAQLTQASARKVIADVIAKSDVEHAEVVIEEGQKVAAEQGKQRPTAAMLSAAARELFSKPAIPAQPADCEGGREPSEPKAQPVPPQLLPLSKATDEMRERAYKPLAPAAVKAAAEADPVALAGYLDSLEAEIGRVQSRIAAARKLIPVDAEVVE
ncbi:hypothetical protein [Kitasatospora sp. NPDC086791]|uniref:hypothetical protein n=1 Tax=Kitasatospora sp. NPDC086791 TaxID=3155178 RepID=UPI00342A6DB5